MRKILLWTAAALTAIMASCTDSGPGVEPQGMVFLISGVDISGRTITCEWMATPASSPKTKTAVWNKKGRVVFDITGGVVKTLHIINRGGSSSYAIGRAPGKEVELKLGEDLEVVWRTTGDDNRLVGTAAELIKMRDGESLSGNYIQEADLDLCGQADWMPIGYPNPFTGRYNGDEYTIDNMVICQSSRDYIGLFGYSSGSIVDVVLGESCSVTGDQFVGGVCGKQTNGTISSCKNKGGVSGVEYVGGICGCAEGDRSRIAHSSNQGAVEGAAGVGGICGENAGVVVNCSNHGAVEATDVANGGICGRTWRLALIDNCTNSGNISGKDVVGGICGASDGFVKNCNNSGGTVSGSDYVGGICGGSSYSLMTSCNNGRVQGAICGGLCGANNTRAMILACYNAGEVSASSIAGGVCAENSGKIETCYNAGSVSATSMSTIYYICPSTMYLPGDCYYVRADESKAGLGSPSDFGCSEFGAGSWPDETMSGWETGANFSAGLFWKTLGGWNGGSPNYPQLWWEE